MVKDRELFNSVYSTAHLFKDSPGTYALNEKFFELVSEKLKQLIDEMRDLTVPFRRTKDQKVCAYCDFKTICGR